MVHIQQPLGGGPVLRPVSVDPQEPRGGAGDGQPQGLEDVEVGVEGDEGIEAVEAGVEPAQLRGRVPFEVGTWAWDTQRWASMTVAQGPVRPSR